MADLANGRAEGKSSPEKLDRLLKFLYEMDESKPEEVKEALASQGIDTEELVKEGMQLIRSFEKTERVKLAQAKRKRLAEIFDKLRSIDPSQSIDAVRKRIDDILKGAGDAQLVLSFQHKHEKMTEDDLRNLLSDAELLNLLEEELKKLDRPENE